jgi:signal peptidase II
VGRTARLAVALYGIAALVYLVDRLSKIWAERSLAGRPPLELIPGVLQLNFTTNSGGAFSIGGSAPWVFTGATVVVVAVIVVASTRLRNLNVFDRLSRSCKDWSFCHEGRCFNSF